MDRRQFLASLALPLTACDAGPTSRGGFVGMDPQAGHRLRDAVPSGASAPVHQRTRVLIVGGGVAGLAAARALRLRGMHDFVVLEGADTLGGNARSTRLGGLACPMGAHYLPVPGHDLPLLQDLLEELGLRRRVAGRWVLDERHLCHSPQERLFFQGHWQEGLLPMQDVGAATLAQYRAFAARVQQLRASAPWRLPALQRPPSPTLLELDQLSMAHWLGRQRLDDPHLRWYLNYCCRDEYGSGLDEVSAWAAIHYFASRHGFRVPGDDGDDSDGVLTWPEGNAWLTQRLAAPLVAGEQSQTQRLALRVEATRSGALADALDLRSGAVERWQAEVCILALPVHIAAHIVQGAPDALRQRAAQQRQSAWVVANLHVQQALDDHGGAAPAWDNVRYDGTAQASLGYVNATHQSLHPVPGATVLTWYQALGSASAERATLLQRPWMHWRDAALADLAQPHPDLRDKLTETAVTRHGHAMAVPTPGSLRALAPLHASGWLDTGRLRYAHSDWAGYSVFEEAFSLGHAAGSGKLP